jgi:hypothetical protein
MALAWVPERDAKYSLNLHAPKWVKNVVIFGDIAFKFSEISVISPDGITVRASNDLGSVLSAHSRGGARGTA